MNLFGIAAQRVALRQAFRQKIGVALNYHQQIIEVVSDSSGKSSDRFHFLGLSQLLFELFAVGDVERHADRAFELTIGITKRLNVARIGTALPLDVEGHRFASQRSSVRSNRQKGLIGSFEIFQQRFADELVRF